MPASETARKYPDTALYRLDSERKLRFSHENPEVQKAYEEFLGKPLSRTAHKLLHSEHVNELYFETHNYL